MAFVRNEPLRYRRFGEPLSSVFDTPVRSVNRPQSQQQYVQQPYLAPQQEYIQQPYIAPTPRMPYPQGTPMQPGMISTQPQPPYSYRPPAPGPVPIPVSRQEEGDSIWPALLVIIGLTVLSLGGYFTYSYVQTQNRKREAKTIKEEVLDNNAKRSIPKDDNDNDDDDDEEE